MGIGENFEKEILDGIKEKHLKPKARWTFLLKDYVVWALGLFSLVLGAVAFSVVIYLVLNNDWAIYEELTGSLPEFIFLTMPYFWLIFLALFIVVVNYNIQHTKQGYKLSLPLIIPVSIGSSMLLGGLFYGAGLGQAIDDVLGENISFYDTVINPRIHLWDDAEKGRLTGLLIDQIEAERYRLIDIGQREWLIDMSGADLPPDFEIRIGRPVKLLGEQSGSSSFIVERIFHHEGPGRGMMMERMRGFERSGSGPVFMEMGHETCGMAASGSDSGICPMMAP